MTSAAPAQLVRRAAAAPGGEATPRAGLLDRSAWTLSDLVALGGALAFSGISLLVGWYGAAHTTRYSRQLLWIVVGGGGLIVGALGVAVWLLKGLRVQHERAQRIRERAQRLDVVGSDSPLIAEGVLTSAAMTRYHRDRCPLTAHRELSRVPLARALGDGKLPCGVCGG